MLPNIKTCEKGWLNFSENLKSGMKNARVNSSHYQVYQFTLILYGVEVHCDVNIFKLTTHAQSIYGEVDDITDMLWYYYHNISIMVAQYWYGIITIIMVSVYTSTLQHYNINRLLLKSWRSLLIGAFSVCAVQPNCCSGLIVLKGKIKTEGSAVQFLCGTESQGSAITGISIIILNFK